MSTSRILIVDDDPALLAALSGALKLRMSDLVVETCDSALTAIQKISHSEFDAVVTDIKMPGMSGRELGRIIEERWPGKPILYMSGFASEVFRDGLLEPGAPFLAKPFTQDDLAAKVRVMLEPER